MGESYLGVADKGGSGCNSAIAGMNDGLFIAIIALAAVILIGLIVALVRSASKKKVNAETETVAETAEKPTEAKAAEPEVTEKEEVKEEGQKAASEEEPVKEEVVEENITETEEVKAEEPAAEEKKEEKPAEKSDKPAAKPRTAAKTAKAPAKTAKGKWVTEKKSDDEYIAKLLASNGEVILTSEIYSTAEGATKGVATIVRGVENGKFVVYNTKGGDYYFKLKSASNKLLCAGEIYTTKDGCLAAAESVKKFAKDAVITGKVEEGHEYVKYVPAKVDYEIKKGARGKWKVEKTEDGGYLARLYASNGQLMLSTEEVKERKTAEKAIESVKKNSAEANFIIDKDKFGRFYYKLRNANKSVICIGEGYDTEEACISALESVRKFSATATIVPLETATDNVSAEEKK